MTIAAARATCFLAIVCLVPWPMHVLAPIFAPAVHYVALALVIVAVVVREGASGPVPVILAVFAGYAAAYVLCSWVLAWALTRFGLARLSPARRRAVVWVAVATGVMLGVCIEGYATPLSRRPRVNVLGVLS